MQLYEWSCYGTIKFRESTKVQKSETEKAHLYFAKNVVFKTLFVCFNCLGVACDLQLAQTKLLFVCMLYVT